SGIIIWIDVITFITAVIPLVVISIPHINSILESNGYKRAQTSFVQEFTEGIQILKSKTGLLPLLYVFTAINFLEIPIIVLGPIFIYSVHLGQATDLALVVAASQLGMLLSGLWILFRREWRRKAFIIIVALYIQLFGYFLQVITPTGVFWFMAIGTFIFGTTLPITNAMFKTIFQVLIPPELQGRVTAITAAISGSIMPIAMLLSGPIAEILGFVEFFLLTIILGIIVITVMWLFTDLPALDELQEMNIQKDAIGPQNVPGVTQ
ncbi:MAG: hypothetical protein ACTSPV_18730, partial [Candidatus Hodarchaeales archaeon]